MKHPLHPLFTHFPIALWITSLVWDFLGILRGDPFWWSFSFWSIALGLIISFLTLITGMIDYTKMPRREPEETIAMKHLSVIIVATIMYAGSLFARIGHETLSGSSLFIALGCSIAGCVLLVIGAWYGGELVHRYGVGRVTEQEAPKQEFIEK